MTIEPNDPPERLEDMSISAEALIQPPAEALAAIEREVSPSFDAFYRNHYDSVSTALAISLGSQELGREAADEAMTRAYAKWHAVVAYDNPAGWIYKVGLNWGRSWHRKVAKRASILRRQAPTDYTELPRTGDIELHDAMSRLDAKYRSVVVCRYLLDWSTDETAQALDLRPGTVKSRLSVALDQLRNELDTPNPSSATATDGGLQS